MKKFVVIIAIIAIIVLAGCASTGRPELPGEKLDRLDVDLSKLPSLRNANAFTKAWDDFIIDFEGVLPEADDVNWAYFTRFKVVIDMLDANGNVMTFADFNNMAMMTLVYNLEGIVAGGPDVRPNLRGGDPGINIGNAAQKQFNLMGSWSNVHTRGCMIALRARPAGLLLQVTGEGHRAGIRHIQIKEAIFYNDDVISFEDED
ncbi:MAG: hypothetical protein FWD40_08650 [Treponema sp.]|nr:hypothetical protein [Treponema sp.]